MHSAKLVYHAKERRNNMAKIKDINGDGKRNFKDTWLGEKLLGGGKNKGPNLKESMAGARRESSAAPMKSPAPKDKPAAKPTAKSTAKPKPVTKDAMSGYRKGDITTTVITTAASKPTKPMPSRNMSPTPDKAPGVTNSAPTRARMGSVTKAEYDAMSPAQRKAKGLPLTWTDRIFSPSSNFKKGSRTNMQDIKGADAVTGFNKGGMAKKGKC